MSGVNLGPINKQRANDENIADTSKIRIVKPTHLSQVKDSQSPINIEPHTTNNRTNSKEAGKLLMLKNFQPSK